MKPSHADALGLIAALVAAAVAHRFALGLELMGWDSYPLIAASRIEGLGDLGRSFCVALMDGRYPRGDFYRPVTALTFGWDHAWWGLRPAGYLLTNLLLQLAGVVLGYGLARRWLGSAGPATAAALVLALHPALLEVVPTPARRADLLTSAFAMAALWVQPLGERAPAGRLALGAGLALLAAAAKETGFGVLLAIAAAHALLPVGLDPRQRLGRALRRSAPAGAALLLLLGVRTAVLGGLGGHPDSSPWWGVVRGLADAPGWLYTLVMPQPWLERPADRLVGALLLLGIALALALGARAGRRLAVPAVSGVWLLGLALLTGVSGDRASWYAAPLLPPYALAVGWLAAGLRTPRAHRGAAVVAGAVAAVLLASHLRFSALVQPYGQWQSVSRQTADFLARFREAVETTPPGRSVRVAALPLGEGTPLERVGIRSALGLSDYSAAAFAELVLPERPVRVVLQTGEGASAPSPGVVTVDVVPLPSPVLRSAPGRGR